MQDTFTTSAPLEGLHDIVEPGPYEGTPAVPLNDHLKTVALTRKLGDMRTRLFALERELRELRTQGGTVE